MVNDLTATQTVCTQPDAKGKPCHGPIKRYHPSAGYFNEPNPERLGAIQQECGPEVSLVLMKCEDCGALYRLPESLRRKWKSR